MKRRTFLLAGLGTVAVSLVGCGGEGDTFTADPVTPRFRRGAGGLIPPPGQAETFPLALDPDLLGLQLKVEVPASFQLAASVMPPVIDQGDLESCGAFACAYAVGSAVAAKTTAADVSQKAFQNSPGYAYKVALGEDGIKEAAKDNSGTYAMDYYNVLVASGNASFAAVGYPDASLTLAQEGAQIDAIMLSPSLVLPIFQLGSWHYIKDYRDIDLLKKYLVGGRPLSYLSNLYENYYDYTGDGVFVGKSPTGAYHFQAIIGYDDTMQALRVQNSWGTDWGDSGYCWMSYQSYLNAVEEAHVVYPIQPLPADGTGANLSVTASDGGGGLPVVDLPRVDQAQDGAGRVYLIFWHVFSEGLRLITWTVTDPEGNKVTHTHGHFSRVGYYYLTRQDGQMFEPGAYSVDFLFANSAGREFRATGTVNPSSGGLTLPPGNLGGGGIGAHNGLAVTRG